MAWEPDGGYGDGALVAGDLLAAARERGVRYRPHTPVLALLREGDRVTGIQTPDGPEHAQVVVAAAGVWSPALLASIGVDLPIETEFHQVAVLSHAPGQGTPVACIDSTTQSYFRPEAGGSMTLVGSFTGPRGVDPDSVAPQPSPPRHPRWRLRRCILRRRRHRKHRADGPWAEGLAELVGAAARRVPALADAGIVRGITGVYDMTPDGRPMLGELPGLSGLVLAAGLLRHRVQDLPGGRRGRGGPGHRQPGRGQRGHRAVLAGPVRRGPAGVAPAPVLGRLRRRACREGGCGRRDGAPAGETRRGRDGRSGDGGVPLERSLPGRSYTSEAEFARERDQVLLPGWFCVGRADGLTEPGCYLAADVCGESIIVTRTEDGGLAGYYNLCRHRGSRLVPRPSAASRRSAAAGLSRPASGPSPWPRLRAASLRPAPRANRASGRFPGAVRCPYHAWTYGLDGTLRAAPFLPALRKHRAALSLHRVDVATWGGFVFARLEPPAAPGPAGPFEATLGEIAARVAAYPLADLRTGARLRYDVAANWKVILENYNECYHCGPVHPELCELVPAFRRGGGDLDWEAGIPHRPGATTFTSTGTTRRAPFPGLSEVERTRHFGELVLPNLMLSLSADHVAAFTCGPAPPGDHDAL